MVEVLLSYGRTLNATHAVYMRCMYVTSEQKRKYARAHVRDAFYIAMFTDDGRQCKYLICYNA